MSSRVLEFDEVPSIGSAVARSLTQRKGKGQVSRLPDLVASVAGVRQDLSRLAAYDRVCGYTLRDEVPASWLHVLTFGLQTALMAQSDFPFSLAGLVHASNHMTLHRPVRQDETLHLSVRADHLGAHRRGATFEMLGEVRVGTEVVWSGASRYLVRGAKVPQGLAETAPSEPSDQTPTRRAQKWRLPADLGRRYAAVSGDINPIHLNPLTARLFGFKAPIIHGMWTHARSLAALEGRIGGAHTVDVRFTKPILLPGTVGFAAREDGDAVRFAVLGRDDKSHMEGLVRRH